MLSNECQFEREYRLYKVTEDFSCNYHFEASNEKCLPPLRFSRRNRARIIRGMVKKSVTFLLDTSLSVTIDLPLGGVKCSKSV